ncbi:MAG TPA: large conductance mechanosensitive channel protein MscL [Anaerolineae bacterium]|nr:large conductance mechanosensitive channel protein MscL [Anaerolineae bacterium]
MIREFREFIMRGNVIDLAVAFIMGGAFGAIVSSLVKDIIMPLVGLVLGGVDFANMFIVLKGGGPFSTLEAAQAAGAVTLNYGVFINLIINFLIIALAMFMLIKAMNTTRRKKEEAPAPPPPMPTKEEQLLTEIRDLLKDRK